MQNYIPVLMFLFAFSDLFSQAGQLDETFNATGKVITHIDQFNVVTSASHLQEDGKILVCGTATTTSNANDFVIARYTSDGLSDTSFNQSGYRVIDFFGKNDYCYAIDLQPDRKILLTGIVTTLASKRQTAIVRLMEDGSFDETFGDHGIMVNGIDHKGENPRSIHYQDGKIIVTGSIEANLVAPLCALFRYNNDGTLDQSFGDQGLVTAVLPESYNPWFGMTQHDGKIIAGGLLLEVEGSIMLRFTPQGIIDSTFGSNGIVEIQYVNEDHKAYTILEQPDHKILVVDGITHGGKRDFAMLRYTEHGILDSTFGINGKVVTAFSSGSNTAHAIGLQEDQKILLAGFLGTTPNHDFALARYSPDGTLDMGFGNGGKVITNFGQDDLAFEMMVQPDKKIVLAGHSIDDAGNSDFALSRYLSGLETVGTAAPEADAHPMVLYPNPAIHETTLCYFLPSDQRISIRLCGISGQHIQTLVEGVQRNMGEHKEKLVFDLDLLPGNYVLVLETEYSSVGIPVFLKSTN